MGEQLLKPRDLVGKTVVGATEGGPHGFGLRFDDGSWCYIKIIQEYFDIPVLDWYCIPDSNDQLDMGIIDINQYLLMVNNKEIRERIERRRQDYWKYLRLREQFGRSDGCEVPDPQGSEYQEYLTLHERFGRFNGSETPCLCDREHILYSTNTGHYLNCPIEQSASELVAKRAEYEHLKAEFEGQPAGPSS